MNFSLRSGSTPLVLCLAALTVAACGTTRECEDPKAPYLRAESRPELHMPDGFTAPDRSAVMLIPEASGGSLAPVTKDKKTGRCLDEPPPYYGPGSKPGGGPPAGGANLSAPQPVLPATRAPLPTNSPPGSTPDAGTPAPTPDSKLSIPVIIGPQGDVKPEAPSEGAKSSTPNPASDPAAASPAMSPPETSK